MSRNCNIMNFGELRPKIILLFNLTPSIFLSLAMVALKRTTKRIRGELFFVLILIHISNFS